VPDRNQESNGGCDNPANCSVNSVIDLMLTQVRHGQRNTEHAIAALVEKMERFMDESRRRDLVTESRLTTLSERDKALEERVKVVEREADSRGKVVLVASTIATVLGSFVTWLFTTIKRNQLP